MFIIEHGVEQTREAIGPGAQDRLGFTHRAAEQPAVLLQTHEFIGYVERGENRHAQGVDCIAVGGYGAHFGVDIFREFKDVIRKWVQLPNE